MSDKVFCSYRKLIKILRSRGLVIPIGSGGKQAVRIFERNSYYSVINGYKDIFLDPATIGANERYLSGTTLNEIYALYCFDASLRNIILPYILRIENAFSTVCAYEFPQKYGHRDYLVLDNFDTVNNEYCAVINFLAGVQKDIAAHSSTGPVNHYLTQYGYIPLWVLVNILSLGTMSRFYSLLKQTDRQNISKRFGLLEHEMRNAMKILTLFRNVCAHGNRLYCYKTKDKLCDNKYHRRLSVQRTAGTYKYGKDDLFALLIVIDWLLDDRKEMKKLIREIDSNLKLLATKLNVVSIDVIKEKMGFPTNWKDLA